MSEPEESSTQSLTTTLVRDDTDSTGYESTPVSTDTSQFFTTQTNTVTMETVTMETGTMETVTIEMEPDTTSTESKFLHF